MIIYRIKNKDDSQIYAALYDEQKAIERLSEANQGVFRKTGWPKGEYLIEIFQLDGESFDNEKIF